MRYFKCDAQPEAQDLQQQFANLSQCEQKKLRLQKPRNRIGNVLFFTVTVLLLILGFWFVCHMSFWGGTFWQTLLLIILEIFCFACVTILAPILGVLAAYPFWNKDSIREKKQRRELLQLGCQQQRDFYGFREPFWVTKCFDASDKRFRRHDVCLFMADGELRLTVNLHYGFFDPARDLGCYAFSPEEVTVRMTQWKAHPALELTAGETTFLLGTKALPFLKKEAGISPEPAQEM